MKKDTKPAKVSGFSRWLKRVVISPHIFKILNALKFGWLIYKYPYIVNAKTFEILIRLAELILKVSTENKPYGTHIGIVCPETGKEQELVSIWAGAGIGAEPLKRIKELSEENELLKLKLKAR